MMHTATRDEFRHLAQQVNEVVNDLWRWPGGEFCPMESWTPAINVYHLARHIEICVDLAGVDPSQIELRLEPGRLVIRGHRAAPDPRQHAQAMRIDTMEIDHGPFGRTIPLPGPVDHQQLQTRQDNGLLWIRLFLLDEA